MKILKYLTMLSAAAVMATACEVEPKDLFSTDPVAPVLASHNAVLLNGAAANEDVTFSWSAARNVSGDVVYSLELSYDGNDAALVSTDQLYYTTSKETLWTLLLGMGAPEHEMFSFSLQVTASGDFDDLVSESVAVQAYINEEDVAPVLTTCPEGEVLEMGKANEALAFAWTPAFIGAGEGITYSLYVHTAPLNDAGAAISVLAEELTDTTYEMTKATLNNVMLGFGIEAEVATDLYFTVAAVSGSYPDGLYSESKLANFTAYVAVKTAVAGWSIIGNNNDWDTDIEMIFVDNGLWISPITYFNSEFKLRFAHGWDVNRGGNGLADGATIAVENNGPNMSLSDGSYYIVYNEVNETISAYASWQGWGLIGDALANGWDGDTYKMLEVEPGVFKSGEIYIANGGFKFRKDNDWGVNFGGTFGAYGSSFTAVDSGDNIELSDANTYVYTTLDTNSKTITVDDASSVLKGGWSVTGEINGTHWDSDVRMYQTGNVWRSIPFQYDTHEWGFKIRKDGEWNESYGGSFEEFGKPFGVTGDNCSPESLTGKYIYVVYDPAAATLTVYEVK